MRRRDLIVALASATACVVLAGGVAWAAIPSDGGVIQGCYTKIGGILRVIDTAKTQKCHSSLEIPISWNQKGTPGLTGPKGDTGPAGDKGDKGDSGAGLARLDDLIGLPCSSTFNGRVLVALTDDAFTDDSVRSSAIALRCVNEDVRRFALTVTRASDIPSQAAQLSGRVRVEPWASIGSIGDCPLDTQCGWDLTASGQEVTATAIAESPATVFVEWRSGPCAGSTEPACVFSFDNDVTLVAIFGAALLS